MSMRLTGSWAALAQGDLTIQTDVAFQGDFMPIQHSIEGFIQKLSAVMSSIQLASEQVFSGSDQVSSGAQALAQGASAQEAAASAAAELTFGSNMRASAAYRKTICPVLVRRAIEEVQA